MRYRDASALPPSAKKSARRAIAVPGDGLLSFISAVPSARVRSAQGVSLGPADLNPSAATPTRSTGSDSATVVAGTSRRRPHCTEQVRAVAVRFAEADRRAGKKVQSAL